MTVLVAAYLGVDPVGSVHRVCIETVGHLGASRLETLCGISAHAVRLADDAPVDCEPCLMADGDPAVREAQRLLVDARRAVPA